MSTSPQDARSSRAEVRPEDLGIAVVLVLVSAVVVYQSLPHFVGQHGALGAGAYPTWLAIFLGLCGVSQIARVVTRGLAPAVPWPQGRGRWRLLLAAASMAAYLFLLDWIGFWFASSLVLLFQFRVLGSYSWRVAVPMAIVFGLAVAYTFGVWLYLPLPRGVFGL